MTVYSTSTPRGINHAAVTTVGYTSRWILWVHFLTLSSFPANNRDFKNLKGTWHQMHARSGQLQGVFGFLKPLIHVWILVWSWSVDKNDPVQSPYQPALCLHSFSSLLQSLDWRALKKKGKSKFIMSSLSKQEGNSLGDLRLWERQVAPSVQMASMK